MATITQYTKKDGSKAYMFQTYLGVDEITGKKRFTTRRGFATKKQAQLALNKLLIDIEENGFNHVTIKTFDQLYKQWLTVYEPTVKPSTFSATLNVFNLYILPKFQKLELAKITVSYCQQVLDDWHANYKAYKGFKMKLNLLFDYAVSLEAMANNPMKKTQTPRKIETDKPINFFTKEELLEFLSLTEKECDPMKHTAFHLMAFTGMRKSELLALQWSDIDYATKELTIGKTVAVDKDSNIILQKPKTINSYRTINLDNKTIAVLKNWQRLQRMFYLQLGYNVGDAEQHLFTNKKNQLIRPSLVNGWLRNFYRRHMDLKKITVHGFRYTHCSLLFESGASIKEVQGRLGHKDVQTTMNIYAKVTPQMATNTGEKFASFMGLG